MGWTTQRCDVGRGRMLSMDWFHGDIPRARPVVVCIHGGGWVAGDRSDLHPVAENLARQGFAAACVQYRFAPEHPYPAAAGDCLGWIEAIRRRAAELGADPTRMATWGNSAGGHLAALVGLQAGVQAVVDICGVSDLTTVVEPGYELGASFAVTFMGKHPAQASDLYREASPISHVSAAAPPFFIAHGEADDIVPISQSVALRDALRRQAVPVEYHPVPNEGHSFTFPAFDRIEGLYTSFLKEHLSHVPD